MLDYVVVEFIEENGAVSVVHKSWIESGDMMMHAYWPPNRQTTRARKRELPDKAKWKRYPIRIFKYLDDFEVALEQAKEATVTSSLGTGDELPAERKRRKPDRYEPDIQDGDDEREDEQPSREKRQRSPCMTATLPEAPTFSQLGLGDASEGSSFLSQMCRTPEAVRHREAQRPAAAVNTHQEGPDRMQNATSNQDSYWASMNQNVPEYSPQGVYQRDSNCTPQQTLQDVYQHSRAQHQAHRDTYQHDTNQTQHMTPQLQNRSSYTQQIPNGDVYYQNTINVPQQDSNNMYQPQQLPTWQSPNQTPQRPPPRHQSGFHRGNRTSSGENEVTIQRPQATRPSNDTAAENFRVSVLMKLESLEEKYEQQLVLLRQIACGKRGVNNDVVVEDVLTKPMDTPRELNEFSESLDDVNRKKSVVNLLSMLGGHTCGDTVRRILRKLGSFGLWSQYSLKGKRQKLSLQDLTIYRVILKACLRTHPKAKESEIEEQLAETLKHAPSKPGGSRHKKRGPATLPSEPAPGSEGESD